MEHHPLLKQLLQVCSTHNVSPSKAYTTFEVYQELSEVRRLSDLNYFFIENLKLFYLSGKIETSDEYPSVYVPLMYKDEITPQRIKMLQEILSPDHKEFYLFIRDRDSSSACYCITRGLKKPDSPSTSKRKKETEKKKYQFYKNIMDNGKLFYAEALKEREVEGIVIEE